jgi:hypothetical protein
VRIQIVLYPCCTGVRILKQGLHPFWLLLAESQYSVIVLNIYVSDNVYYDSFWLLSWWYVEPCWHFTALQHSIVLIDCYFSCWFLWVLGKLIKPYTSCIQLLRPSLCCIGANKVLHVFSVPKMIMIVLFLFGHDSLLSYRITHIYMLWVHKNKGHDLLFPCVGCSFWVLHLLHLVLPVVALPMVIQLSFHLRGTKLLRWLYESLIMDALFVLFGIFWRLDLKKFPIRETIARCYCLTETID